MQDNSPSGKLTAEFGSVTTPRKRPQRMLVDRNKEQRFAAAGNKMETSSTTIARPRADEIAGKEPTAGAKVARQPGLPDYPIEVRRVGWD